MKQQPTSWAAKYGAPLSRREMRVLILIAEAYTDPEVAASMGISVRMVRLHRQRLEEKTGWRERVALARYALAMGLVENEWPTHRHTANTSSFDSIEDGEQSAV